MAGAITIYTRNILESGTVTVTGTPDTGFPEARLYDRALSLFWKDTVTEAKNFLIDQGASGALAVDFLAIGKHNFSGIDMQWQWSTDNFSADINDAVVDWTQGDNNPIVKTLDPALTKRYWRVTLASMANPKAGEVFMSAGFSMDILYTPGTRGGNVSNTQWNRTVGGTERSTKFGPVRRQRSYPFFLSAPDLASLRSALDDLDELSKPFYIKDHEGDCWLCRLTDDPLEDWDHLTNKHITLNVIEVL